MHPSIATCSIVAPHASCRRLMRRHGKACDSTAACIVAFRMPCRATACILGHHRIKSLAHALPFLHTSWRYHMQNSAVARIAVPLHHRLTGVSQRNHFFHSAYLMYRADETRVIALRREIVLLHTSYRYRMNHSATACIVALLRAA